MFLLVASSVGLHLGYVCISCVFCSDWRWMFWISFCILSVCCRDFGTSAVNCWEILVSEMMHHVSSGA